MILPRNRREPSDETVFPKSLRTVDLFPISNKQMMTPKDLVISSSPLWAFDRAERYGAADNGRASLSHIRIGSM